MKDFKQLYNEASLSRVYSHTQKRNIAIISAQRQQYTKRENDKRTAELKTDIRRSGFGFLTVKGKYEEINPETNQKETVTETSFLIIGPENDDKNKTKQFAISLGKKYQQDSVLIKQPNDDKAYLVGTNSTGFPGLGKKQPLGKWHPNRTSEYMTALKGTKNKTFVFENIKFETSKSFFNRKVVEF